MIVAASRMPIFIYNLYNDALYKIEKSSFTKDSLAKEISNLSFKKEHIIWNDSPQRYIDDNAPSLPGPIPYHTPSNHAFTTLIRNP